MFSTQPEIKQNQNICACHMCYLELKRKFFFPIANIEDSFQGNAVHTEGICAWLGDNIPELWARWHGECLHGAGDSPHPLLGAGVYRQQQE